VVGAGTFELPTPCAQGGLWNSPNVPFFQVLVFSARYEN
jgi:hypothetical protein